MVVLHNTLFVCLGLRKSLVALGVTTLALLHSWGLLQPHNIDLRKRCHLLASCREVYTNCLPPFFVVTHYARSLTGHQVTVNYSPRQTHLNI